MKKILTSETAWKIYSVLLAIMLWCAVMFTQNPERTRQIKNLSIEFTNNDAIAQAGFSLVIHEEPTIDLKISGKKLYAKETENIRVMSTVPNISPGTYELPVDVTLPSGVNIVSQNKNTIRVTVEKKVSKAFPIDIVINNITAEEDAQMKKELGEESVTVTGPQSVIESIGRVYVRVDKNDAGKKIMGHLLMDDKDGNIIDVESYNIHTSIPSVYARFVKLATADTTIEAVTEEEPAKGYVVGEVKCLPETVLLGAEMNNSVWVESVLTSPISLAGKTESFTEEVTLQIPEEYELMEEVEKVKVYVEILPKPQE